MQTRVYAEVKRDRRPRTKEFRHFDIGDFVMSDSTGNVGVKVNSTQIRWLTKTEVGTGVRNNDTYNGTPGYTHLDTHYLVPSRIVVNVEE